MPTKEGYRFVPLPDAVHRERRPHARLDRRVEGTARLTLEISYKVALPVHVGAGHRTLVGHTPVRVAARSGGRPVIPGSSLKGLLRARYEAITNSCSTSGPPRDGKLTKTLPSRSFLGYQVVFDPSVRQHEVFERCPPNSDRLCAACALFGRMSLRGRVAVRDLLAPEATALEPGELPKRFSPRPHHLGHYKKDERQRLTVTKLKGRKFYRGELSKSGAKTETAELIPRGTMLSGTIVCTNITAAELGGLLIALGSEPGSRLRVGAAKAYPFGLLVPVRLGVVPGPPEDDFPRGFFDSARAEFEQSADRHAEGEQWLAWISGEAP